MTGAQSLPNAFLLGAPKAGTTSLASYLDQHPDVFLAAKKEPNFHLAVHEGINTVGPAPASVLSFLLHRSTVSDPAAYAALYAPGADASIRLDASVRYLSHPVASASIADTTPDARLIAVLRDPVERIVSHWRMNRQFQLEPLGLRDAFDVEEGRITSGWGYDWHYRRVSTYAPQIRAVREHFDRDQLLIVLYGDLVRDPDTTLRRCFAHLGVDPAVTVDRSERGKVPTEPRWKALDRKLNWPTRTRGHLWNLPRASGRRLIATVTDWNSRPAAAIASGELDGLSATFDPDRIELADLLDCSADELVSRMAGRPPELQP